MAARSEASPIDPDTYQGKIRRLLVPVKPMPSETLHSYLYRLTEDNHLFPGWLPGLARKPDFLPKLAILTGYSDHQLVATLPELCTHFHIRQWPHLLGEPSAFAQTRAACSHCVAARLHATDIAVTVFATHEQLICHKHQRWLGGKSAKLAPREQFSIASCPEITIANRHHQRLIATWGRAATRACFTDAAECMKTWSRWLPVLADLDIRRRWTLLGVTEETPPHRPPENAALYPNVVALTELILTLRRRIAQVQHLTAEIAAESTELFSAAVVAGLTPRGAADPFRRALLDIHPEQTAEAQSWPEITELGD